MLAGDDKPDRKSPAARTPDASLVRTLRSKVTNGTEVLPGIDRRSALARRYRDIVSAILTDQGGIDRCSESRQQLIRRFAAAAVLAEQMEARLVDAEQINVAEHALLTSTMVRVAQRVGIDRKLRTVVPSLSEYLDAAAKPQPRPKTSSRSELVDETTNDDS